MVKSIRESKDGEYWAGEGDVGWCRRMSKGRLEGLVEKSVVRPTEWSPSLRSGGVPTCGNP